MNVLNRESFTSHCRTKQQPEQVKNRHGSRAPPSSAMPTDAASEEEAVRVRCHSCTEQLSSPFSSSNVGHLKEAHPPWKGSPSIPNLLDLSQKEHQKSPPRRKNNEHIRLPAASASNAKGTSQIG